MKAIGFNLKKLLQNPLVRIGTSLVIVALLLYILPLSELVQTLSQISIPAWLLALFLFLLGHSIGVVKWRLLISIGAKNKLPWLVAFRCYYAGLFSNLFLPSIAGGDVVRAGLAIQYSKESETIIFGSVLDRFLDMCALATFVILGAFLSSVSLSSADFQWLKWFGVAILAAGLLGVGLLIIPIPDILPKKLKTVLERTRYVVFQLIKNPQRAILGFMLALLIQGLFVIINVYFANTVGIKLALPVWFFAWPLAKLAATMPISMGGLGVREVAMAAILGGFGIPPAKAVGISLLWESVLIAGAAISGLFFLILSWQSPRSRGFSAFRIRSEKQV